MASGVTVTDKVKDLINDMKVVKNDADQNERVRVAIFGFVNDTIDVTDTFKEKDLVGKDPFLFFKDLLENGTCRYILYDCQFDTKEGPKKQDLVFASWCSENAEVKIKMKYASSKDALKKCLHGVKHDLQLNDLSDCGDRDTFAAKLKKDIIKLEGVDVNPANA